MRRWFTIIIRNPYTRNGRNTLLQLIHLHPVKIHILVKLKYLRFIKLKVNYDITSSQYCIVNKILYVTIEIGKGCA